jgi:hypothetical protein
MPEETILQRESHWKNVLLSREKECMPTKNKLQVPAYRFGCPGFTRETYYWRFNR